MNTTTKQESKQIAMTILQQLGGRQFMMMTGTKPMLCGSNYATFKLKRNKSGANVLKITLTAMDVYDMEFVSVIGMNRKTKESFDGVYDDMLAPIFESVTGFYTKF